jgi:hypothetical protein
MRGDWCALDLESSALWERGRITSISTLASTAQNAGVGVHPPRYFNESDCIEICLVANATFLFRSCVPKATTSRLLLPMSSRCRLNKEEEIDSSGLVATC